MGVIFCDFCSDTKVVWAYPATSFAIQIAERVVGESCGGWAACDACSDLVERDDRAGLARRAEESVPEFTRGPLTVEYLTTLHNLFFKNRIGPRELAAKES